MKRIPSICISATLLLLAGCTEEDAIPFPDGLETVWGEMMAPYGLYPLFPVRTGVQPGDVVVQCKRATTLLTDDTSLKPNESGASHASQEKYEWKFLFSLTGISEAMASHAKSRMQYTHASSAPATSGAPLGAASITHPYLTGNEPPSIGLAGFPSVLSYRQNAVDAGIGGATGGTAAVGAGAARRSSNTYLLEIPAAEFAELPYVPLQQVLENSLPSGAADTLARIHQKGSNCLPHSLSVVGAAFYARRITVSMADSYANAISARAAIPVPADSSRKAVLDAVGNFAMGPASGDAASVANPAIDKARFSQLLADIDAAYKAADDNSRLGFTGVKIGFAKAAGKGISMDYSYALPVAFGVRLYSIQYTPSSAARQLMLALSGSLTTDGEPPVIPLSGENILKDGPKK